MKSNELRIGKTLIQVGDKYIVPSHLHKTHFSWVVGEKDGVKIYNPFISYNDERVKPIPLTEEWLKKLGFEYWDEVEVNEHESFKRYVLYNIVEGTSNYEVHLLQTTYANTIDNDIMYSIDIDERQHINETKYVHNLQNSFYQSTGKELTLKE